MICPKCGLNNLEHVAACVRCGERLTLPVLSREELVPPRAKRKGGPRKWLYRQRRKNGFKLKNGTVSIPLRSLLLRSWHISFREKLQPLSVLIPKGIPIALLGVLIPSVYEFYLKRWIAGTILLILFVSGLISFPLLLGTRWWMWALALIVLAQTCAICDILTARLEVRYLRVMYSLILSFILFIFLNALYVLGVERVLEYFSLRMYGGVALTHPEIYPGNYLRMDTRNEYRRGDVVLFNARVYYQPANRSIRWEGHRGVLVLTLERILAIPGDSVEVRMGKIFLNGSAEASEIRQLNPEIRIPDQKFELGKDEYFLWPGYGVYNWRVEYSKVPSEALFGRALAVIFPLWRYRRL